MMPSNNRTVLGGTMRTRTTATAAVLLLALAGCSSSEDDSKPKDKPSKTSATAEATTGAKTKLEPVWGPKLDTASEGAGEACATPSSSDCAESIDRIMTVVADLDTAIEDTGKRYPQTTAQIVKMQDAEKDYTDEGCEGNPAADDPNSRCWGTMTITVGASILQMNLLTDDMKS